MGTKVPVTIYIDSKYADLIKDLEVVDLVRRDIKGRYLPFIKAFINKTRERAQTEPAIHKTQQTIDSSWYDRLWKTITREARVSGNTPISVPTTSGKPGVLQYLQFGVDCADLVVDIAAFVVLYEKLNDIEQQIRELGAKIDSTHKVLVNQKIKEFDVLFFQYNALCAKIKDQAPVDRDDLESFLGKAKPFITEMKNNFHAGSIDGDLCLEMIFALLTSYTQILGILLREYYFEKKRRHINYQLYMGIYDDLMGDTFLKTVLEHIFIDSGTNYSVALEAVQTQKTIVLSHKARIENLMALLEASESKENFFELMNAINDSAKKAAAKTAAGIAEEVGMSPETRDQILADVFREFAVAV